MAIPDPFLQNSLDGSMPWPQEIKECQRMFHQRYELVRQIGAGGMGVVWLARDTVEKTQCVLKFLPSLIVRQEREMQRMMAEVEAGKKLRHERLVATYGLMVEDSMAAVVMDYIPGGSLKDALETHRNGFFEPEEIKTWCLDILDALEYLHNKAKRVHRDIKPANVLIDNQSRALLADFGISQRIKDSVSRHSRTSDVLGGANSSATLAYASPQQLIGKPAHPGDDIYSFGAMVYELLTGMPPFFRGGVDAVGLQIRTELPVPIQERRAELAAEGMYATTGKPVPENWEAFVRRCLEKSIENRPMDFSQAKEAFQTHGDAYPQRKAADPVSRAPQVKGSSPKPDAATPASSSGKAWLFIVVPLILACAMAAVLMMKPGEEKTTHSATSPIPSPPTFPAPLPAASLQQNAGGSQSITNPVNPVPTPPTPAVKPPLPQAQNREPGQGQGQDGKGTMEEAEHRVMGQSLPARPQVSPSWSAGQPHPRYPNVISTAKQNEWRPASGYVWADPSDDNDWTVIRSGETRSSYAAPSYADNHEGGRIYTVAYTGSDGVSLRSTPGGDDVIATVYKTSDTRLMVISTTPYRVDGLDWVKVRLRGWMAMRHLRSGDVNVARLQNGVGYVKWDGAGDPKDNFVAMRTLGHNAQRLAKVYHNTSVRLGQTRVDGSYEWVESEVVGWIALRGPKGSVLIKPL